MNKQIVTLRIGLDQRRHKIKKYVANTPVTYCGKQGENDNYPNWNDYDFKPVTCPRCLEEGK